jgi:hypothetical protein
VSSGGEMDVEKERAVLCRFRMWSRRLDQR